MALFQAHGRATLIDAGRITAISGDRTLSNVKVVRGGMLQPQNGVTITIESFNEVPGAFQWIDLSLGGTVTLAPGSVERVLPEWVGATVGVVGAAARTLNTAALEWAFTASPAAGVNFQPTGGTFIVTAPPVYLCGRYQIDDDVTISSLAVVEAGPCGAVIEQTNTARAILVNRTGIFRLRAKGITFLGGTRQVDVSNPNTDMTVLDFDGCEFQLASDYAIHTLGLGGWNSPVASSTLSGIADAGDTVVSLASAASFVDGDIIMLENARGEYHATVIESIATNDVTLREAIPAHWTGVDAAQIGGAAKDIGAPPSVIGASATDGHMSANLLVRNCVFSRPRRALFNCCDLALVENTWTFLDKSNFDAGRAAFHNLYGAVEFNRMFGVPTMGTQGVDRLALVRWIDNYGSVFADASRFGAEEAGMPPVYNYGGLVNTHPFQGSQIVITRSQVGAGPSAAADNCVVNLVTDVPCLISLRDNHYIADAPLIFNGGSLDLDAQFDGITELHDKYKIDLDPNMVIGEVAVPEQLLPFVHHEARVGLAAAPTVGYWKVGQRVRNTAPAVVDSGTSDYVITGWVCTVAGEPGTWVEMRTLTGT